MKMMRRREGPLQGLRGRVHCRGKGNVAEGAEGVVVYCRLYLWEPGVITSVAKMRVFTVSVCSLRVLTVWVFPRVTCLSLAIDSRGGGEGGGGRYIQK
jgi:hypothetical protein